MSDLVERLNICIEGTASVPNIQQAIIDAVARIAGLEAECTALAHDMERARDAANEHLASLAEAEGRVIAEVVAWLRATWMEDDAACVWAEVATALENGEWKK